MKQNRITELSRGIVAGGFATGLTGVALLYLLNMTGIMVVAFPELPGITELLNNAWANLRLSAVFFLLVLVAFVAALKHLNRLLSQHDVAHADVMRADQLVTLCTTLFFGIGVIWTAIGMRSALLYALGDPGEAAQAGAFAMLQRMVDGGILLALSTTIVGGIGGYLMRVIKMLVVGRQLQVHFETQANRYHVDVVDRLQQVVEGLQQVASQQERMVRWQTRPQASTSSAVLNKTHAAE